MLAPRIIILFTLAQILSVSTIGQSFRPDNGGLIKNEPVSVSLRNKFSSPPQNSTYPSLPSHRTCATDEHMHELATQYPEQFGMRRFEAALAKAQTERMGRLAMGRQQETLIQIPIVIHVVHNGESVGSGPNISQAQVNSQIDVLNEDFRRTGAGANSHPVGADVEVEFVLALYDPNGVELPEPGINRVDGGRSSWTRNLVESRLKPDTQWDPEQYFNVWTVNFGGESSDLLGYAQFPSLSDLEGIPRSGGAADTDGVVCRYNSFGSTGNVDAPYDQGRTMTHEVGHWLGLRHIWGDGDCTVDDFCDDTPLAAAPNYSCVANNSCTGSEESDMIENYMDYTNDACMNIFTVDQKARMRTVLEVSPRRKELVQNVDDVIEETDAPIVAATTSSFSVCQGDAFTLTDVSTNNPTSRTWTITNFADQIIATSTDEVFVFDTDDAPLGDLNLELIVSNASGSDTLSARRALTVYSNATQATVFEDLESTDNTDLVNWAINNPDDDRLWSFSLEGTSAYGEGDWSLMFDNYSDDDDPTGTSDALVSPRLDFSGVSAPQLTFDYAYARFSEEYSDTLAIFYSTDCGNSWSTLWSLGGAELETAPTTTDAFFPTASQWASAQINLQAFAGNNQVHFAIVNFSGWGNLLYVDNFVIYEPQASNASVSDFMAQTTRICEGDEVSFQDNSTNLPNTWSWTFEGASPTTSTEQNPNVRYNNAGEFDVALTTSNSFGGDSQSRTDYIEVVALPTINITGDTEVCAGTEVTLQASGGSNLKWFSRGSLINEGSTFTVFVSDELTFQVSGENELGCEGFADVTITISTPTATISVSEDGSLLANEGATYQWYRNDTLLSGETNQSISPDQGGEYTVEVTNSVGCTATSAPQTVEGSDDGDNDDDVTGFSKALGGTLLLYPNPAQEQLTIHLENANFEPVTVVIFSSIGSTLWKQKIEKLQSSCNITVPTSDLPSGLYWVQISQGGKQRDFRQIAIK
ncbi:MAG TPA: hypothetical protein DCE41_03845 [Cytophagales bacterium]|nr:hypothetical protein [Cytophagales bacterium]HAA21205.1 hypothetical protein [Cytophagales bacterium]HAP60253.1 hypothetical protein [Cytophagales bacterium]